VLVKVAGKNVSDFDQIPVLRKSLLAVCVCRHAVCYLGEKKIRMMILLYCMISTYDMITSLCMKLGLCLHAALRSFPYLGSYVLEFVSNQTQSVGKTEGDTFPHSFPPHSLLQAGPNGF